MMILREYLYVDTDKVRSMLAQLEGGVAEESRRTEKDAKRNDVGVKGYLGHNRNWGTEEYLQKSLGDAWFPLLEDALESENAIRDISELVADEEVWYSSQFRESYPPGSIVRASAPGFLFDAQYLATGLGGFSTTWQGYSEIYPEEAASMGGFADGKQSAQKRKTTAQSRKNQKEAPEASTAKLEDEIIDFPPLKDSDTGFNLTPEFLRSVIKISRGMFRPGLHLNLLPTDSDELTINIRLQEGRQYLDSDAEMLFARYGIGLQEWTVVGSIGYFAPETQRNDSPSMDGDEGINRVRFAQIITAVMGQLGGRGFTDMARFPGFTIVPFAVYRSIPRSSGSLVVPPTN